MNKQFQIYDKENNKFEFNCKSITSELYVSPIDNVVRKLIDISVEMDELKLITTLDQLNKIDFLRITTDGRVIYDYEKLKGTVNNIKSFERDTGMSILIEFKMEVDQNVFVER